MKTINDLLSDVPHNVMCGHMFTDNPLGFGIAWLSAHESREAIIQAFTVPAVLTDEQAAPSCFLEEVREYQDEILKELFATREAIDILKEAGKARAACQAAA